MRKLTMKTALIQAPCWVTYSPPYNLALLKSVCREQGHDITCLDFNIRFYKYLTGRQEHRIYDHPTNWYNESYVRELINGYPEFIEKCVDEIIDGAYQVIGFTATGLSSTFSKVIAERIKERDAKRIIVFGGPYCFKVEFGETLLSTSPYIDAVCYHEGEKVLPQLLETVKRSGVIALIPGIAFRGTGNEIIDCSDMDLMEDLSSLPFADYSDFKLSDYESTELPISTSRGCINRCMFCSESSVWKKYRFRNAESIFEEIKYQKLRYPLIKSFFFNDSLINGNINMLDELCDLLIKNKTNISWGGQAVIREEMTRDFIQKAKKSGLSHVSYGLESASPRILKMIGKRFTPVLAERVVRDTKKAGIRTDVNIIAGFPEENENDIVQTINFLKANKEFIDEIFFHPLVVSRGCSYYDNRSKWGIEFQDQFNPNSWYSTREENTLEKRLERLRFYQEGINRIGESFFSRSEYYLFIADSYFDEGNDGQALVYYGRAKECSEGAVRNNLIEKKEKRVKERYAKINKRV